MRRFSLTVFGVLIALAAAAAGQAGGSQPSMAPAQTPAAQHVMLPPAQMTWAPGPPALPAGAQMAVLSGDPGKPEAYTISAKLPDGYTIPPHWHPADENVVVVEGTLMLGMGETMAEAMMTAVGAGGYARLPPRSPHYVKTKGATTIVVYGMGPFEVTYVNPNDDPRKKTSSQ